jgi:cytochrome c
MRLLLCLLLFTTLAAPAMAADLRNGRELAKLCRECHAMKAGGREKFGPNLHGVFGRAAGSVAGYPYSDAMAAAGWVWNEDSLDTFITDPRGRLPGTQMPFPGLPEASDRTDLIAYLMRATRK